MITMGRYGKEPTNEKFWAMIYSYTVEQPQRTNIIDVKSKIETEDDVYGFFVDKGIDVLNIEYYGRTVFN
jgi:hypothetical protein